MFNIVDLIWVEHRGMSVITAIFFVGCFCSILAVFWWIRKELDYINTKVANHTIRLNNNADELAKLNTQLAVIHNIVQNTECQINRLVDKIYK